MNEPVIRIYLTPKGVYKVDAPVSTDEDRARAFEFLADKASAAIKQLDASMRAGAKIRRQCTTPPQSPENLHAKGKTE